MRFTHGSVTFSQHKIRHQRMRQPRSQQYTLTRYARAFLFIIITILSLGLASHTAYADNLQIPELNSQPPNTPEGVVRPVRGLTMDEVREQFGDPLDSAGPIGEPPITRWEYAKFAVVFEGNMVIDSFAKK